MPASCVAKSLAPVVQSLLILLLPVLLVLIPSQGAVRTIALRHVPLGVVVNAVQATGGGIVRAGAGGDLVVTGRRDRLMRALLPLGVLALPVMATGCAAGGER